MSTQQPIVEDPGVERTSSGQYRSLKDGDLRSGLKLGEFFENLGLVLRLPSREKVKTVEVKSTRQTPPWRRWLQPHFSRKLAIRAAGIIALALVIRLWPAPAPDHTLPRELAGTWSTDTAPYANRRFLLADSTVAFQISDAGDFTTHPVTSVTTTRDGEWIVYTVSYRGEGGSYDFPFRYNPSPTPVIRFENQKELVWRQLPTVAAGAEPHNRRP